MAAFSRVNGFPSTHRLHPLRPSFGPQDSTVQTLSKCHPIGMSWGAELLQDWSESEQRSILVVLALSTCLVCLRASPGVPDDVRHTCLVAHEGRQMRALRPEPLSRSCRDGRGSAGAVGRGACSEALETESKRFG